MRLCICKCEVANTGNVLSKISNHIAILASFALLSERCAARARRPSKQQQQHFCIAALAKLCLFSCFSLAAAACVLHLPQWLVQFDSAQVEAALARKQPTLVPCANLTTAA